VGDDRWTQFADFGLQRTYRPFGYLGAQASYWWQQGKDWWKAARET
jgi:hypothetical protein